MAVAENPVATSPAPRTTPRDLNVGLASIVGGVVILLGFLAVFAALPVVWSEMLPTQTMNEFLSGALLLIVGIAALVAVLYIWFKLDQAFPAPGLRAGSVFAAAAIFIGAWIVFAIGNGVAQDTSGMVVTVVVAAFFLALIGFTYTRPGFAGWLASVEEGGWFTNQPFKGNQGVRVRRGTVVGLLTIGFTGIYTMWSHQMFGTSRIGAADWYWYVPFTDNKLYIPLIYKLNLMGPIFLGAAVVWFSWRLVNWPPFADFLVATEAEMNKVSWTTRRRLFTDTIVVLVTTFFLTAFLFTIDILWFKILSSEWIHVLHVDLKAEQAKQQEKTQW